MARHTGGRRASCHVWDKSGEADAGTGSPAPPLPEGGGGGGGGGGNQPDEIEEQANAYFQKIYQSEESAR